ncbi:cytochrome P450 2L1-like [Eriocheir sinensis]|uniref:cytochrome P450 2L1-like n=1 Tax=Eriocheir sinensis TaxID=95602 RepID=UPI0021C64BE1|nr:cytochrome P450 2L1-like [Eriocheir sinensis]XP_050734564.1 cytochrome P450 2L1-like [Eriocheir sinensis]
MLVEVVLLGVLLLLLRKALKKPSEYPPGRWGLPLVGYVPLPGPTYQDHLRNLNKKHGDLYLWRMGAQLMVYVHDFRLMRDAFSRPEFTDRPDFQIFSFLEEKVLGVVGTNGDAWVNNRRFSLRQLRDLGMGKSRLVDAVQRQATWLVEVFKKQAGKAAPVPYALRVAIVNVIWQLVAGKQFDIEDPKMQEFEKLMDEILSNQDRASIQDFLPWLRYIMPSSVFKRLSKYDSTVYSKNKFLTYFFEVIEEHQATLNPGEPRDLIDGYLMEMEQKKNDPDTTRSKRDLAFLVLDLFFAGNETTTTTVTWVFYYLANHPRVQQKLQAEIDAVLTDGRLATLEDKPRLPYTEAVIHEVLRMSSLIPTGVPHVASRDTTLGGYTIPKGAVINGTTFTIHRDPRYWDNPDEFLPERWLDSDGKFVTKKEGFLPFGVGKRQCLGESLARMEILVFSTTVLQQVSFSVPPGKTVSLKPDPRVRIAQLPIAQDLLASVRG